MLTLRTMSTLPRASASAQRRLTGPSSTGLWKNGAASWSSSTSPTPPIGSLPAAPMPSTRLRPSRHALHLGPASFRRRAFSSYEWKNMNKYAQQANKDFATLTKEEIRKFGEEEVDRVEKALRGMEPYNDVFTVRREGLEVFAELGPLVGTYWIKFDLSIYQICMVSPRSGPHRYIYDKGSGRWIGEADKHDFQGMLTRDIIQSACGIPEF